MKHKRFSFKILLEKKGEDAEPILEFYDDSCGCIGVFDGMGGAGSATYENEGETHTGAHIASNFAKQKVETFFQILNNHQSAALIGETADGLELYLSSFFKQLASRFDNGNSAKLKSSLIKKFPTTMAVMYFSAIDKKAAQPVYDCKSFWAGDSRCYVLTSANGLQQISEDDLKSGGDALENLINDSPMSNCISADVDFQVNNVEIEIPSPVIFIVATDGCFGYVPTPAHFEFLLLDALLSSKDSDGWRNNLISRFEQIAGDDVSMSVVCVGWKNYSDLKNSFAERLKFIADEYINPLDSINEKIQNFEEQIKELTLDKDNLISERNKIRSELWLSYKKTYEVRENTEVNNESRRPN